MTKKLVTSEEVSSQAQKNRLVSWGYLSLMILAVFVCAFVLYSKRSSPLSSEPQPQPVVTEKITSVSRAEPARLQIPAIALDAEVESVGLTSKGAMDTPQNRYNVAWYNKGPRPGELGSAVIDGHLDGENQTTAVFKDLNKVKVGDTITIVDKDNKTLTFTVRRTKLFQATDPTTEVFGSTNGIYLNLITCAGTWNTERQDYEERLVVFTELTSE